MAKKYTKKGVNYREGTPKRHCGNCTMYRPNNSCTAVEGKIYPDDLCDIWEGKEESRKAA